MKTEVDFFGFQNDAHKKVAVFNPPGSHRAVSSSSDACQVKSMFSPLLNPCKTGLTREQLLNCRIRCVSQLNE